MRRRTILIAAGSAVALLIAGVGVVAAVNSDHTPEQAVRDYVTLIAQGDAAAANALVDPRSRTGGGEVDPTLLVNGLGAATARITIDSIDTAADEQSAGITTVDVAYSLPGGHGDATLRVGRAPNRYGVLTRWQVIDPLLVPVAVQTNTPAFDTARLGDAEIPATNAEDPRLRTVLLYPAVYELRGRTSTNVDFSVSRQAVATEAGASKPLVFSVAYQPSPALRQLVLDKAAEYVRACAAAGTAMAPNCPEQLVDSVDFARNLSVTGQPTLNTFAAAALDRADGSTEPGFFFMTNEMPFTYTDSGDGKTGADALFVTGYVDISRDDTATVTFTTRVGG